MLPIVSVLLQQGLGLLGKAVMAKGQDIIEEKLGVSLEESVKTEDGLLKLKELEFKHEEFLLEAAQKKAELELKESELAVENTKDARNMNAVVQASPEASWLAKNAAYMLDFLIVGATILLAALLFWKIVPDDNQNLVYLALGSLITMSGTILNFHRGSSQLSKGKDVAMEVLSSMKDRRGT